MEGGKLLGDYFHFLVFIFFFFVPYVFIVMPMGPGMRRCVLSFILSCYMRPEGPWKQLRCCSFLT